MIGVVRHHISAFVIFRSVIFDNFAQVRIFSGTFILNTFAADANLSVGAFHALRRAAVNRSFCPAIIVICIGIATYSAAFDLSAYTGGNAFSPVV